jgi:hypothetical protein
MDRAQHPEPSRAIRLLIEYDRWQLAVRDRWVMEKHVPPSDALGAAEAQSGFWFELRDANDRVLYRRVMDNPIRADAEVHDPDVGLYRQAVRDPKGVFAILVPDLPEAEEIAFFSSPLDPGQSANAADEVSRLALPRA